MYLTVSAAFCNRTILGINKFHVGYMANIYIIVGSQQNSQIPGSSYFCEMMTGLLLIILLCAAVIYSTQSSADPSAYSYRYVYRYISLIPRFYKNLL